MLVYQNQYIYVILKFIYFFFVGLEFFSDFDKYFGQGLMSYEVFMLIFNDVFLNLEGELSIKQGKIVCIFYKSNLYKVMY